jgi:hypothetical protein
MPRRLARKLILSITVIVLIVAAVSGLVNVKTEEKQLLNTVLLGAGQLSKGITSATWHAMLDDHREAAYQVMQTIALKQGIDRIRMFNSAGTSPSPPTRRIARSRWTCGSWTPRRWSTCTAGPTAGAGWTCAPRSTTRPPAARRNATRIRPTSRRWACWTCR